jgi:hypothetical protein
MFAALDGPVASAVVASVFKKPSELYIRLPEGVYCAHVDRLGLAVCALLSAVASFNRQVIILEAHTFSLYCFIVASLARLAVSYC